MLTVLLATKNRAAILRRTLESFCLLRAPSGGWKLVIVDNGSADGTPAVLSSFASRLPLKVLSEPRGGKNAALNAGLRFLEGDLAVFTDDDAFPRPDWMVELREAADTQLAYSIFGGAVVPRWEVPPPAWVEWLDPGPVYALTDPTISEGPVRPELVFGPNMAIRATVFRSGICFDTSIGPRGSTYAMGSETELTRRLYRQGHKAWHAPRAVVEHLVSDYQLRQSWVLKRAIRYGRGRFRLRHLEDKPVSGDFWFSGAQWCGVPRRFVREIVRQEIRAIKAFLRSDKRRLFAARWTRNYTWGNMIEAYASRRGEQPHPGERPQFAP